MKFAESRLFHSQEEKARSSLIGRGREEKMTAPVSNCAQFHLTIFVKKL